MSSNNTSMPRRRRPKKVPSSRTRDSTRRTAPVRCAGTSPESWRPGEGAVVVRLVYEHLVRTGRL